MRKKFWTILLTLIVFLSGAMLALSTVYRVETVTVNVQYVTEEAKTKGEVLQAHLEEAYEGVSTFFVKQETADEVLKEYPYFRLISFEKSFPKRIVIDVVENAETYAVKKAENEYYILSSDGVVLDIRDTYVNALTDEENVILTGLNIAAEKGQMPLGDECFVEVLATCQALSTKLNGIRANVVSVELMHRTPETVLAVTMREGVKIYLVNSAERTAKKIEVALAKYFSLSDEEKMCGRILLIESSEGFYADYSKVTDF